MQETIETTLLVQVETVSGQYLIARLLPPWRSKAVGREWKDVEGKLRLKASRELAEASPRKWLMNDMQASLPSLSQTVVELGSPVRGPSWRQPLELKLDTFRWELPDAMCIIKIPAVRCDLFGKSEDISQEVILKQVRVAVLRLGDHFDLWNARQKFFQREFRFETLVVESPVAGGKSRSKGSGEARQRKQTVTLRSAASDLTQADLDPVYGRDAQVREVSEYLIGQMPQSVLLVGPAGVGKTALVHRLVQMSSEVGLGERKVWSTTGSRLVSGMSGMGMWQERCLKMIREAHATSAVVHVGSVIELMEAGKVEGQPGVASMIRQAIARGRLLVVAECTPQQIALVEREEPLLLRSMVRYDVTEPDPMQLLSILRQAADQRAAAAVRKKSHRSHFTDAALEELSRLHRRYATYSALPAQPLRLLQTILERSPPASTIDAADVARAFAAQTGLPGFLVDDSLTIDLDAIRDRLSSHVIGQVEPVELVVNLIATLKSRMVRPGRPLASLLFIGPTGVGKTEMAKAIAGLLYSDTRRMVRIDMSEYASPWSAVRLIGRPDEGDGTLTSPIREQPFSVVLLDEFEKADPAVIDMLLQLLGEGRLTDSLGRLADFRNAVVIMTSNLGVDSFRGNGFGFAESGSDWRSHFEREVQRYVRPELLGRIDRIVPFSPLPRDVVRQIAVRELGMLSERPGIKYADVRLEFAPEVIDHLCQLGYQPKYGARQLRRAIEQHVTVPLANQLANLNKHGSWLLRGEMRDGKITIAVQAEDGRQGQHRQSSEVAIDDWQSLGRMARLAMNCSPLRDLENETQRLQRINDGLFDKLKDSTHGRRATSLKLEIQQNAVSIERNTRIFQALADASRQITAEHESVMLAWYRNVNLPSERLFSLPEQLRTQLRSAVVGLLDGRSKAQEDVTILILGKPMARAAVLWEAYERLAVENQWRVERYSLKVYEPARDRESPEYRKRQSRRKSEEIELQADQLPSIRLVGSTSTGDANQEVKACDAYRVESSQIWMASDPSVVGIAMQLTGVGVQAWLGNESGVMHFIDSNAAGPKRRQRFRVVIERHALSSVRLGKNWQEPTAMPDRDPRRTFNLTENLVIDGLSNDIVACGQSKHLDCLMAAIRYDRERLLWAAVDFTGIPSAARLRNDVGLDSILSETAPS